MSPEIVRCPTTVADQSESDLWCGLVCSASRSEFWRLWEAQPRLASFEEPLQYGTVEHEWLFPNLSLQQGAQ